MNDDPFYSADGTPVIPMIPFFYNLPVFAADALLRGRIFEYEWWDLHWRMFLAARLRERNGKIVWRVYWKDAQ